MHKLSAAIQLPDLQLALEVIAVPKFIDDLSRNLRRGTVGKHGGGVELLRILDRLGNWHQIWPVISSSRKLHDIAGEIVCIHGAHAGIVPRIQIREPAVWQ